MRRAFGSLLLLAAVAGTTFAVADNKRASRPRGRAKPALSAPKTSRPEAHDERARPEARDDHSSTSTPSGGTPGEGETPGEEVAATTPSAAGAPGHASPFDGGVRSSPLNPRSDELADAGAPMSTAELERVMGDIAALRGRIAAVSDTLFKSRLLVRIETRGDHARIDKLTVSLDEGAVYTAPSGFSADEPVTVYEHAVAPGRHLLGVSVERRDDRGEAFRTSQASRFAVEVPENERLEAVVRIDDDSDMGTDFPSNQRGTYELRVRVRARASR